MVEKIKTDLDRLLLNLTMQTDFPTYFNKIELFSFPKLWKKNSIYFQRKYVELPKSETVKNHCFECYESSI